MMFCTDRGSFLYLLAHGLVWPALVGFMAAVLIGTLVFSLLEERRGRRRDR